MSRRGGFLAILILAVSLPVSAEADCGCGAAAGSQPCTEEVLATAALPAPAPEPVLMSEMEFSVVGCWGCDSTNPLPLPLLLWGLLFSAAIAIRRVVCGPDRLIVLRLTAPPSPRMPAWTTNRSLPRFALRSSLSS